MALTIKVVLSFQVVLTSFLKFRLRLTKLKKKPELQRMPHKFWAQLAVVLDQLMQARLLEWDSELVILLIGKPS
jgi:hypothetical protein